MMERRWKYEGDIVPAIEIVEIICTLVCILSGIGAFVIWRIWPSNDPATYSKGIRVLKTMVGLIFVCSGLLEFILQLVGLF